MEALCHPKIEDKTLQLNRPYQETYFWLLIELPTSILRLLSGLHIDPVAPYLTVGCFKPWEKSALKSHCSLFLLVFLTCIESNTNSPFPAICLKALHSPLARS